MAATQRLIPESPGVLVALALVGVLVVASVISVVLWSLSDYDPNDVDGDGIANGVDDCYDGFTEWTSSTALDMTAMVVMTQRRTETTTTIRFPTRGMPSNRRIGLVTDGSNGP